MIGAIDECSNKLPETNSLFKIRSLEYTEVIVIGGGRRIRPGIAMGVKIERKNKVKHVQYIRNLDVKLN